jgi:hypothetical protein
MAPGACRGACEAAAQGDASSTEGRRTLLNFKLDIRNGGDVLERMGLPHTLRDGKGTFEGRIAWRGSPMSIDYPTLSGRLKLNIENGQILSVDPGAARLLGVLSLQSLLRFATLDFRSLEPGDGVRQPQRHRHDRERRGQDRRVQVQVARPWPRCLARRTCCTRRRTWKWP